MEFDSGCGGKGLLGGDRDESEIKNGTSSNVIAVTRSFSMATESDLLLNVQFPPRGVKQDLPAAFAAYTVRRTECLSRQR